MPRITLPSVTAPPATIRVAGSLKVSPQLLVSGQTRGLARNVYAFRSTKVNYIYTSNKVRINTGGYSDSFDHSATSFASGGDGDGFASLMTGTEANGNTIFTTGQALLGTQRRWGWHSWSRVKLPTSMTSLTDRNFGFQAVGSGNASAEIEASNLSAATALSFIVVRWRQGTNGANWSVRVGNGANAEDALDTGVAVATGTLYHIEVFAVAGNGTVYCRINDGITQQVTSSRLPGLTTAMTLMLGFRSSNHAAVTGNGAIAQNIYEYGLTAP